MAHINPSQIEKNGLDFYRMRVPVWENYLLYALSHLKPDTYLDYEFCSYRRALRRGTGRCGQQSLALVDFLSQQGIETGFVRLGGHALVTAKVADATWYMLDADFGGVIPFDLAQAERDPASVLPHYWNDAASKRSLHLRFGPENNGLRYGGPEARFGRACRIEYLAYIMKWLIPVTLLLPLVWVLVRRTKRLTNLRW